MRKGRAKLTTQFEAPKRRRKRWWMLYMPAAWPTALSFLLGSCLFLVGSTSRLFLFVSTNKDKTRLLVLTPYFLGSLCFTCGCFLPLPNLVSHYNNISQQQGRKRVKGRNEREAAKDSTDRYNAQIDIAGALLAVSGGLMINSATGIDLYQGSKAELIFTTDRQVLWTITVPTMTGRALFILAGWFTWAARNQSWQLRIVRGSRHFRWTTVLFWIGTLLFYAGWFCGGCSQRILPGVLVKNWCCVLGGYILGSLCLIAAAGYLFLDLNKAKELQSRQGSEVEAPLLQL